MRYASNPLLFLAALCSYVYADVEFTVPAAGASVAGGTAFTVTWTDSGDAPSLSDLAGYQLMLYTGSNATPQQLYAISTGTHAAAGATVKVTIPVGTGGSVTNAYFFGMISTATAGGTVTNFSKRFSLTGMTGSFSAAVTTALGTVSGTSGPATVNAVADAADTVAGSSAAVDDGVYGTPYSLQTGPTKYASMQPLPGTAITATNTAPLYPTSSLVLATTFLAIPTVVTTVTQSLTDSHSSHANTVQSLNPDAIL
ncbi:hypothetical protein PVAG01_05736 [Phlyctema vagabunda]|uniref:Uncharacterized protein n=1 Tax=Phlyctema vagabunda TaxID=108571 RepID=A0ABR4PKX1_9HELO